MAPVSGVLLWPTCRPREVQWSASCRAPVETKWMASAGRMATQRVNRIMKELLADYEAPAIDAATVEELDAFVVNRKKKIDTPPESC